MQPKSRHDHWPAVAVIGGIDDVLNVRRDVESFPDVHRVVALEDVLAPVVQRAVADDEPLATERQVFAMVTRQGVRCGSNSEAVLWAAPFPAVDEDASGKRLVDLGECIRLGLAIVPAKTPVGCDVAR